MVTQHQRDIEVTLNGRRTSIPPGLHVAALLEHIGVSPADVAVEIDRQIVRRADWSHTVVNAGAAIEVVRFVGGG